MLARLARLVADFLAGVAGAPPRLKYVVVFSDT